MIKKLKQFITSSIKNFVASCGYVITRKQAAPHTMDDAFRAIAARKHFFNTVVDIGASDGHWTSGLMRYFPQCQYLLIEANPIHEKALNQFTNQHQNVQFVLAAAGASSGQIYFDAGDPWGGQASYTPYPSSNNIEVPVTTIDQQIQSKLLAGPYLLKLDTHGFEIPILKGASQVLKETDVIIIECYNFRIAPECLLFFEMCDYLGKLGFRCIDLVDPFNRPYDQSFWQMDLVFVKDNRAEFAYAAFT
ncbi:MAG: FkbM family methyltransferase [Pseudanabaena sp. ELA645]|jgi:FkbM family methyltransferase